jgi:hypothetical protein
VDILQEWDRHSTRRIRAVESGLRRINSQDVSIGNTADGRILIQYGCRDDKWPVRRKKMKEALNKALVDWDKIVKISCRSI